MLRRWAVEMPGPGASPVAEGLELWDSWLDEEEEGESDDPEPTPPCEEAVVEVADEIVEDRVRVRPRVYASEGGDSSPLEEEIGPILARHECGAICVSGPDGVGKSTALVHLARVVPPHFEVSFLDEPDPLRGTRGGRHRVAPHLPVRPTAWNARRGSVPLGHRRGSWTTAAWRSRSCSSSADWRWPSRWATRGRGPAGCARFTAGTDVRMGFPYLATIVDVVTLHALDPAAGFAAFPLIDELSWGRDLAHELFLQDILGYPQPVRRVLVPGDRRPVQPALLPR